MARVLCDAHELNSLLDDEEERTLLEEQNPELLAAYETLIALAKQP